MAKRYTFLDAQQRRALASYKYAGSDTSLIYQNLLSPLAQSCVDICPAWLAPNVITLLGLLFSILALILTLIFNPSLEAETGPRWLHLVTAGCMFAYQTLDNMDGKQARKIGASSPLGLLFDHGCDSLNTGILLIPVASVVGAGWSMSMICVFSTSMACFFFQTWEEYYLKELVLPIVNGPTEGLLVLIGMSITSFFVGSGYWQTPSIVVSDSSLLHYAGFSHGCRSCASGTGATPDLVTPWEIAMFWLMALSVVTCTAAITKVLVKLVRESSSHMNALSTYLSALYCTAPLLILAVGASLLTTWSREALQPRCRHWTLLFLIVSFAEAVIHVMISHVTSASMRPLARGGATILVPLLLANLFHGRIAHAWSQGLFTPLLVGPASNASYGMSLSPLVDETLLLPVAALASTYLLARRVTGTYTEVARTLGIEIFTIKRKKKTV